MLNFKKLLRSHFFPSKLKSINRFNIGIKKTNLWPIALFHARRPKFRLQGKSTMKKRLVAKFFGLELTAKRPLWSKMAI